MHLSKSLLFSDEEFNYNSILNGTSIRGSYNTMQFVLRLRDDIRKALNNKEIDFETIQASSTSLHENIHWWQHIGSNFGFLYSLSYPAFAHLSKENLDNLIADNIRYKSLIRFDEEYYKKTGKTDILDVNTILNNYYDIEYAKLFALDNKNIKEIIKDNRFFLHLGHCYNILWAAAIETIASVIDRDHLFLPKPDNWISAFRELTDKNINGFFIDSPMTVAPLGIKAIYEGQARFIQMQYLTVALNPDLTFLDFENIGMLDGVYSEAFDLFLNITGLEKPTSIVDSIVGLFLLVCDLAINPNNGFPLEIYDYENFINKNDPGIRFFLLCVSISESAKTYCNELSHYTKEEYIYLSKKLSESIGCKCPYESIQNVLDWANENEVAKVLNEEEDLQFSQENLPIRIMFSKYFRFQEDKLKYPNVFCWFGLYARSGNPNIEFEVVDSIYQNIMRYSLMIMMAKSNP